MIEQRNTFKNKMQESVSLAATVGKQKSLIRSVANSTAQIGKQKTLIRKVAGDVALRVRPGRDQLLRRPSTTGSEFEIHLAVGYSLFR